MRQQGYEAKSNLGKNHTINFCAMENQGFQPLSGKAHLRNQLKISVKVD